MDKDKCTLTGFSQLEDLISQRILLKNASPHRRTFRRSWLNWPLKLRKPPLLRIHVVVLYVMMLADLLVVYLSVVYLKVLISSDVAARSQRDSMLVLPCSRVSC